MLAPLASGLLPPPRQIGAVHGLDEAGELFALVRAVKSHEPGVRLDLGNGDGLGPEPDAARGAQGDERVPRAFIDLRDFGAAFERRCRVALARAPLQQVQMGAPFELPADPLAQFFAASSSDRARKVSTSRAK